VTIELVDEAVAGGARREAACETLGLAARTIERWRGGKLEDERRGPTTTPANKLTAKERELVLTILNEPAHRDLSPNQVVPKLADEQRYVASESTMYRILREEDLLKHRGAMKAPQRRPPREHVAVGPNQVWSWDITYLKSPVRGVFLYLYMIVDVWSRKVVGWHVHDVESDELAAALFEETCVVMRLDPRGIVLHADNGGPMKGSTMVATLERLGVLPSFSRPSVSNDNPYSESLFRTLKYRPEFPSKPFVDVAAARTWVKGFVAWYNGVHRHSAISFVTPNERHDGKDATILADRHAVYELAKAKNPARWTSTTRNWARVDEVRLNPADRNKTKRSDAPALGCVVERGAKGGVLADRGSPDADDIDGAVVDASGEHGAPDASVDASKTPSARAAPIAWASAAAHRAPRRAAIASSTSCVPGAPPPAQQRPDNATTRTMTTTIATTKPKDSSSVDENSASRGHARARDSSRSLDARA
jgi:transposase InsO family protein